MTIFLALITFWPAAAGGALWGCMRDRHATGLLGACLGVAVWAAAWLGIALI